MPSDEITLRAGGYEAVVARVGGALVTLRHDGRDLVQDVGAEGVPLPRYRGAVLAPWPNRIRDGAYDLGSMRQQLPVNEVDRACALHGLLLWTTWHVVSSSEREVVLADIVQPQQGYPCTVEVQVRYLLGAGGLDITVTATNLGKDVAPVGTSIHPYLVAGAGMVDDWTFHLDAADVLEVDDRLLPLALAPVDGTDFDFRTPRQVKTVELDHAYTGVVFDENGTAAGTIIAADGHGTRLRWDERCTWVQVHTTDTDDPATNRSGLAFEPMTCPPDAFNSGTDLWLLAPGESRSAWWAIDAI